jgi:hypothetical protein
MSASVLNCTFHDEDACGFTDVSPDAVKWIRTKQRDDYGPGNWVTGSRVNE